jgi:bacillolysin
MKYNSSQTACETFSYGEVEDYTVVITGTASTKSEEPIDATEIGNEAPTSLTVFPNPTNNTLNVTLNNEAVNGTVKIYSLAGSLVKSVSMSNGKKQINVSDLPAGVYIISVDDPKEPFVARFVKQ